MGTDAAVAQLGTYGAICGGLKSTNWCYQSDTGLPSGMAVDASSNTYVAYASMVTALDPRIPGRIRSGGGGARWCQLAQFENHAARWTRIEPVESALSRPQTSRASSTTMVCPGRCRDTAPGFRARSGWRSVCRRWRTCRSLRARLAASSDRQTCCMATR